jgi:hypothetical protein
MTFALAFAPRDKLRASTPEYRIHPDFCVSLGAGTLLVFSPTDDLFFTHEAWFEDSVSGTHRLAFVFRRHRQDEARARFESKAVGAHQEEGAAAC